MGTADGYVDGLSEAADTPVLNWADCGDGFLCATAQVPLDYNRPRDESIDLAVIKKGYGRELLALQTYHNEHYEPYQPSDGLTPEETQALMGEADL